MYSPGARRAPHALPRQLPPLQVLGLASVPQTVPLEAHLPKPASPPLPQLGRGEPLLELELGLAPGLARALSAPLHHLQTAPLPTAPGVGSLRPGASRYRMQNNGVALAAAGDGDPGTAAGNAAPGRCGRRCPPRPAGAKRGRP